MPRLASSSTRTQEVLILLSGSNLKALAYVEVMKNGAWTIVDDVDMEAGIDWTDQRKRGEYGSWSLSPLANTLDFVVKNKNSKYLDGSGSIWDEVFVPNAKVRVSAGYKMPSKRSITEVINPATSRYVVNAKAGTSSIDKYPVSASYNKSYNFFDDLMGSLYGSGLYGSSAYGNDGYAVMCKDFINYGASKLTSFSITTNTTGAKIYWTEASDYLGLEGKVLSSQWNYLGRSVTGTATYSPQTNGLRLFAIAVVFDSGVYDGSSVTGLSLTYDSYAEFIFRSVYYVDNASYSDPAPPGIPEVKVAARDAWRFALDCDATLPQATSLSLSAILKNLLDISGVPYSASSISDLTSFGLRSLSLGSGEKSIDELIDMIMQIANQEGGTKYELFLSYDATLDSNIAYLQPRPTSLPDSFTGYCVKYPTANSGTYFFADLLGSLYGSKNYGSATYGADASAVFLKDFSAAPVFVSGFSIISNTTAGTVFYCEVDSLDELMTRPLSTQWINCGALVNGNKNVTLTGTGKKIFAVGVVFNSGVYDGSYVGSINITGTLKSNGSASGAVIYPSQVAYKCNMLAPSAPFIFDRSRYSAISDMKKDASKLLSRLTVVSDEKKLGPISLLSTLTVTANGRYTLSWASPAFFKKYTFVGGSCTSSLFDAPVAGTSLVFDVSNIVGSVVISVYGCLWEAGAPTYAAEYFHHANMLVGSGISEKMINPLVISSTECLNIAKARINEYGSPSWLVPSMDMPRLNLIYQINDAVKIDSNVLKINKMFRITGVKYHFDMSSSPSDNTSFEVIDTGFLI